MAIKTTTFGRIELDGREARLLVAHMNKPSKPNSLAVSALKKGREVLARMKAAQSEAKHL